MFDLSLAHISHAEAERDLVTELRDRQVLKGTTVEPIEVARTASDKPTDRIAIDRPVARRRTTGIRAIGGQG